MAAGDPHDLSDRSQGSPLKQALAALACATVMLTGCGAPGSGVSGASRTLNVFAAASLTDAFTEMGATFEAAHPDVRVKFNFAGSQTLRAQIEAGASADVFASANAREMEALAAAGLTAGAPRTLAINRLIVILAPGNPGHVRQLRDMAAPGLKLVLAAEEVPAGSYARQSLKSMESAFGADFGVRRVCSTCSSAA